VELSGAASGAGALTGPLGSPKLDLIAHAERVDIPRLPLTDARLVLTLEDRGAGRSGVVSLTAQTPYGPARARTELAMPPGALRFEDLSVQAAGLTVSGDLALWNGSPSQADLRVEPSASRARRTRRRRPWRFRRRTQSGPARTSWSVAAA
jgi:translocation and assembly module TamB